MAPHFLVPGTLGHSEAEETKACLCYPAELHLYPEQLMALGILSLLSDSDGSMWSLPFASGMTEPIFLNTIGISLNEFLEVVIKFGQCINNTPSAHSRVTLNYLFLQNLGGVSEGPTEAQKVFYH